MLRDGLRQFFSQFREKLSPKLIAGGPTSETIKDFKDALVVHPDTMVLLLVDSDGPTNTRTITNLKRRHQLAARVSDERIHLMVQVMEAWFLADIAALREYYGGSFAEGRLPANLQVEQIAKDDVIDGLETATRNTTKGTYHKTNHAPKILAGINPSKVRGVAPSCDRLFKTLDNISNMAP